MSLANINTQINTILSAVSGVGSLIYNYEVYTDDWTTFLNKFKTGALVKGWEYYRMSTPEEAGTSRTNKRDHTFVIRAYYSLAGDGSTMTTFQTLLESVATAFRTKPDLNGVALTCSPLQIDRVENRMFGDTLCHYAEMSLTVEEEEQWTET